MKTNHWEGAFLTRRFELLCPARFDLAAKHIYARWLGEKWRSDWGKTVYEKHIYAFNYGKERCADGVQKNGLEYFSNGYRNILESVKNRGFDSEKPAVPVGSNGVLMDGAHRSAARMS